MYFAAGISTQYSKTRSEGVSIRTDKGRNKKPEPRLPNNQPATGHKIEIGNPQNKSIVERGEKEISAYLGPLPPSGPCFLSRPYVFDENGEVTERLRYEIRCKLDVLLYCTDGTLGRQD